MTKSTFQRTEKVFVYGTLKRGYPSHALIRDRGGVFIQDYSGWNGIMFHIGVFPAVNFSEERVPIHGELYSVDWDIICRMDDLECVNNNLYKRMYKYVNGIGYAWVYVFTSMKIDEGYPDGREMEKVIPTGKWEGKETPWVKWYGWGKGWAGSPPYVPQEKAENDTFEATDLRVPHPEDKPIVKVDNPAVNDLVEWKKNREDDTFIRAPAIGKPGQVTLTNERTKVVWGPYEYIGADWQTGKLKLKLDQLGEVCRLPFKAMHPSETKALPAPEKKEPEYSPNEPWYWIPGGPRFYPSEGGYRDCKALYAEELKEKEKANASQANS